MDRRQRLSRSRDFDAVYRHGRSVSTRSLTLHWFPREDDARGHPRLGLAIPRSVGTAVARNRLKRQLRAAWDELEPAAPLGPRLRARGTAGARRVRRVARARVARRAGGRGRREGDRMRWLGVGLVQAWRHTFGRLTPAGTCKYHPSCSPMRSTPSASSASCAARSSRGGGSSAATRGATAASTTCATAASSVTRRSSRRRDRRVQPPAADRGPPHEPPRVVPRHGRSDLGLVDRGARRARAAPARAGHRAADPLDAEPPGARAGDEGDPAEVEARPRSGRTKS